MALREGPLRSALEWLAVCEPLIILPEGCVLLPILLVHESARRVEVVFDSREYLEQMRITIVDIHDEAYIVRLPEGWQIVDLSKYKAVVEDATGATRLKVSDWTLIYPQHRRNERHDAA